jgi:GNAT superfamily N-acetyltransferase
MATCAASGNVATFVAPTDEPALDRARVHRNTSRTLGELVNWAVWKTFSAARPELMTFPFSRRCSARPRRRPAVWRPDKPAPTAHQVMADPRYALYLTGWPRQGDYGLVAEQNGPVGAAWFRTFTEASHGHGFVAEDVPELAIAMITSRRHQGIGRRLLVDLIEASIAQGYPAMSLSVAEHNPARRLYEANGFVPLQKQGSTWTMIRHTAQPV